MDEAQPRPRVRALTLADVVEAERAQVAAGAKGCGQRCDDHCHGDLTCVRVEHAHDPNADMGPDVPRGNVVPHVGVQPDGSLVQWLCFPEHRAGQEAS